VFGLTPSFTKPAAVKPVTALNRATPAHVGIGLRKVWIPHKFGIPVLGDLPSDVVVEVADDPTRLPSGIEDVEFWCRRSWTSPPCCRWLGACPT
jgi:hypothetical protein